jgi:hypothetical protein
MRANHLSLFVTLLAAGAAWGQTRPAELSPKAPAPLLLPPPPSIVPQPPAPPVVQVPPPLSLAHPEPAAQPENLTTFDPQRTEVKREGAAWQLVVDGIVLKDFGVHEGDARAALRLVRDLGLNQHGVVGTPAPVMEYWLHDGKAPHGPTNGVPLYPLNPNTLRVEQVQGDWCLRDAQRPLFNFGPIGTDAQQALAILRKHGFTQVGALGQSGPVMLIFLGRGPSTPLATAPVVPADHNDRPARPIGFDPAAHSSVMRAVPVGSSVPPVVSTTGPVITAKPTEPSGPATRVTIEWRQVRIQKLDKTWKLTDAARDIAEFASERDAILALSTIQYYHFTEREEVGSPKVHFTYYLVGGEIPRGALIGIHCDVFQPDRLRVVEVNNRWTISTAERVLLSFDDKQDEARHVLDVIQHNKCDRLCRIGLQDEYGLTFLARSR